MCYNKTVMRKSYDMMAFVYVVPPLDVSVRERREKDKEHRLSLVLWRRPMTTLQYFLLETLVKLKELTLK